MPKEKLGFKEGFEYVLDVLCYAYYVKHDNLVSDIAFDELEKVYSLITELRTAPRRGIEKAEHYSNGVQFIYDEIKRRQEENKKENTNEEQ